MQHMDTYLVGAAGVQRAEHERGIGLLVIKQLFKVGDGRFPASGVDDGHFETVDGMSSDVGEDASSLFFQPTLHHGEVNFLGAPLGELRGEREVSGVIFCHDDATAGVFVESVHDAGTFHAADAGEIAAMVKQCVHQGAVRVAGSGVHHHAALLVDHHERGILVENIQRKVLRLSLSRGGLRDFDVDGHTALYRSFSLAFNSVYMDMPVLDKGLNARAGKLRKMSCEILIQSGAEGVFQRFASHQCGVVNKDGREMEMMGYQFTECANPESLRGVVSGKEDVESCVTCSVVNPVVFFTREESGHTGVEHAIDICSGIP